MRAAIAALVLVVASTSAFAQAPPESLRHGLFAGGELWGGNISCNGTNCSGFRAVGGASGERMCRTAAEYVGWAADAGVLDLDHHAVGGASPETVMVDSTSHRNTP